MSLLDRFLGLITPSVQLPLAPSAELQALVWSDIYGGTNAEAVTRESAMTCSPVKRGRAVIVGRLSDLPFEIGTYEDGEFVADATQPEWLTQIENVAQSPWHRFAYTLDDVLFTGWSLWIVERDDAGSIISAERLARHRWQFDQDSPTGVSIDWFHVTDPKSVILFAGPDEGLLITARDAIRGWRYMERAWIGRVRNPIPAMVLEETGDGHVTQDEAKQYVEAWAKARTSDNGAVGFLPKSLRLAVHGEVEADLYDKGRNAVRIDLANQMNLPVAYLDGSTATSSLTYVTQEGTRAQIIDDLEYWIAPFEARLSQADITGDANKVIRLNRSNLTAVPNDPHGPERDTTQETAE
jgi:hypothetical protein